MRRVIPLELVGFEVLDYNLYDETGNIVCKKGEKLTPDLLMSFNFRKIYKNEAEIVLITPAESLISKTATDFLLKSSKEIIDEILNGNVPKVSVCNAARDTLVEEVGENLDKIDCISQLRVYDEYLYSHTINVSTISSALALALNFNEADVKDLALGALLHDIGKIKVPKEILNKPGKLDHAEFEIIKTHTTLGYELIITEMNLSEKVARVALEHQERFSGRGYPNNLTGNEISKFAQIAAVADVYDALVSERVYKKAISHESALQIMIDEGNDSFNPYMLHKFAAMANYFRKDQG